MEKINYLVAVGVLFSLSLSMFLFLICIDFDFSFIDFYQCLPTFIDMYQFSSIFIDLGCGKVTMLGVCLAKGFLGVWASQNPFLKGFQICKLQNRFQKATSSSAGPAGERRLAVLTPVSAPSYLRRLNSGNFF